MVIDLILDRRDGEAYVANNFYDDCIGYENFEIARAMDCGTEEDVKRVLCSYIDDGDYNPQIKDFVNSVEWLVDDEEIEEPKYTIDGLFGYAWEMAIKNTIDVLNCGTDRWYSFKNDSKTVERLARELKIRYTVDGEIA